MRKLNFKQIICGLAFLGLAGFSCFWTAESLFIWQPSITLVGAWLLSVVFCFHLPAFCSSVTHSLFPVADKNRQ